MVSTSNDKFQTYCQKGFVEFIIRWCFLNAFLRILTRYGGIMLGPARFEHIETCTREVCQTFKTAEKVESCIRHLTQLDEDLSEYRKELSELSSTVSTDEGMPGEPSTSKGVQESQPQVQPSADTSATPAQDQESQTKAPPEPSSSLTTKANPAATCSPLQVSLRELQPLRSGNSDHEFPSGLSVANPVRSSLNSSTLGPIASQAGQAYCS